VLTLTVAANWLTGCWNNDRSAASNLPEKHIEITGNDQMKFSATTIEAKPRQTIVLTFRNIGTMPKVAMGHDWVLLEKNTDPLKFLAAGVTHASADYIDPAFANKVITRTKVLGPGESDVITFAAARIPSPYEFICTFPGHFAAGMKGQLIVQ
jgi:azurin